jgi:hypothetical protein
MKTGLQTQKERRVRSHQALITEWFSINENLDKFFSKVYLPWVNLVWSQYYVNGQVPEKLEKWSFWWRCILKLLNTYKEKAKAELGRCDTIMFWHDLWNDQVLKISFPHLQSFARNDTITLSLVLQLKLFEDHFNLPLSEIVFEQFWDLTILIKSLPQSDQNDKWSYIWGWLLFGK